MELPVMGVFEFSDGKINAWRDYFDMAQRIEAYNVAGIPNEEIARVRAAAAVGDFERGAGYVSDLALEKCSVTGTPEDAILQIEAMAAAGVTHVAFGHCLGPDFNEALDLLGREVLPHFRN